jgi:hypothetical protein
MRVSAVGRVRDGWHGRGAVRLAVNAGLDASHEVEEDPHDHPLTARPGMLRQRPTPALAYRRASARRTCPHPLRAESKAPEACVRLAVRAPPQSAARPARLEAPAVSDVILRMTSQKTGVAISAAPPSSGLATTPSLLLWRWMRERAGSRGGLSQLVRSGRLGHASEDARSLARSGSGSRSVPAPRGALRAVRARRWGCSGEPAEEICAVTATVRHRRPLLEHVRQLPGLPRMGLAALLDLARTRRVQGCVIPPWPVRPTPGPRRGRRCRGSVRS